MTREEREGERTSKKLQRIYFMYIKNDKSRERGRENFDASTSYIARETRGERELPRYFNASTLYKSRMIREESEEEKIYISGESERERG